jgi:hypothetical protein
MKLSIAVSGSRWLALRKATTFRPVIVLHAGGELVAHALLVSTARLEHEVAPAVADEAVLPPGRAPAL